MMRESTRIGTEDWLYKINQRQAIITKYVSPSALEYKIHIYDLFDPTLLPPKPQQAAQDMKPYEENREKKCQEAAWMHRNSNDFFLFKSTQVRVEQYENDTEQNEGSTSKMKHTKGLES